MISVSLASSPGGSGPSEDWVGASPSGVVVLDGLSAPAGVGGCSHGTPWYVTHLGSALLASLATETLPIRDALAHAITTVAHAHQDICDLTDPGTPSATVAAVRQTKGQMEALVLSDSSIVIDTDHGVDVLTDSRVDSILASERDRVLATPLGSPHREVHLTRLVTAQRELRNTIGGYWVAQGSAEAAHHAYVQSWPQAEVRSVTLMTDGISRLVDTFGAMTWRDLIGHAQSQGANSLLTEVRTLEAQDPAMTMWPRYKRSDDATVAHWVL